MRLFVKRTGRTYGVFASDGSGRKAADLLEGGFFSRGAASEALIRWERELVADMVAKAERAAGWDPNP